MPPIFSVTAATQKRDTTTLPPRETLTDGEREALWNDGGPGLRSYRLRQKRLKARAENRDGND